MKFNLARESLLTTVQKVIGAVERKQTKPILGYLLLRCDGNRLTVTATDLEIELQATTDLEGGEEGSITVPARKMHDICRALPDEAPVSVALDGERVVVSSGRSRFTLSTLPAADFPLLEEIPFSRDVTVSESGLKRLIERTSFAMANQDVRYYLNGLLLEATPDHLRSVATDGHRLSMAELSGVFDIDETCQIILPRKGVMELTRLLELSDSAITVGFGSSHLRTQLPGVRFTSKLIDGRFPDYERVIPIDGDKIMKVNRDEMRHSLVRASILSNEKYRGIKLILDEGTLRLQAHNPEQEEAEDLVEIDYSGPHLEVGFNANYMLDALNAIDGELAEFTFKDAGSSALIRAPNGAARYVVMPMRL